MISVSADGMNIPAEDLPELFDVFFKTKGNKQGGGYSLYSVKHLLVKLGGSITADVRDGTVFFKVLIPNKL